MTCFSRAQALVAQEISVSWHRAGIRVRCTTAILVFLYLLEGHPQGNCPDHFELLAISRCIRITEPIFLSIRRSRLRHGDVSLAAESESLLPIAPRSARRIEAPNRTCRRQQHEKGARGRPQIKESGNFQARDFDSMGVVGSWQPNAATGWWILADQTRYWVLLALLACGVWCHSKESQSCARPSSKAVGVDGLLPRVASLRQLAQR